MLGRGRRGETEGDAEAEMMIKSESEDSASESEEGSLGRRGLDRYWVAFARSLIRDLGFGSDSSRTSDSSRNLLSTSISISSSSLSAAVSFNDNNIARWISTIAGECCRRESQIESNVSYEVEGTRCVEMRWMSSVDECGTTGESAIFDRVFEK